MSAKEGRKKHKAERYYIETEHGVLVDVVYGWKAACAAITGGMVSKRIYKMIAGKKVLCS